MTADGIVVSHSGESAFVLTIGELHRQAFVYMFPSFPHDVPAVTLLGQKLVGRFDDLKGHRLDRFLVDDVLRRLDAALREMEREHGGEWRALEAQRMVTVTEKRWV